MVRVEGDALCGNEEASARKTGALTLPATQEQPVPAGPARPAEGSREPSKPTTWVGSLGDHLCRHRRPRPVKLCS